MVFSPSGQVTSLGITLSRQTKYLAFYTGSAALLNIILNFILIPKYGMVGAAWATSLSYLFLTVAYCFNSQKFIHLRFDWSKIFKLIFLVLGFILFSPQLWRFNLGTNLTVKFGQAIGFFLLLSLAGVIEKKEIQYLQIYLKKFLKIGKSQK